VTRFFIVAARDGDPRGDLRVADQRGSDDGREEEEEEEEEVTIVSETKVATG
jgi:hypothetical protein